MVDTCECGQAVHIQKTGECSKCYQARYYKERYTPAPQEPALGDCTYHAAHLRVHHRRGKAKDQVCPCGEQALEWSYRGGAPTEQKGKRPRIRNGYIKWVESTWCGDPAYYDALCMLCHRARDNAQLEVSA